MRLIGFWVQVTKVSVSLIPAVMVLSSAVVIGQEWKSGVEWQQPPTVTPGVTNDAPPSDATVLFDGTNLDAWEGGEKWLVQDGVAIPQQSQIVSRQHFGDMQLHVEWSAPTEIRGAGQGRGNSGIFLMGLYEVQVLDSYENETYFDGQAASIYKQTPPMANAIRKPGEWNYYDIFFTVPKFKANGNLDKPGFVTVVHNGVLVLNHFELLGPTGYTAAPQYTPHAEEGPVSLQFHGDPVRFRNIWVRELKPPVGKRVSPPFNIQPARKPKADEKKVDEKKADEKKADEKKVDEKKVDQPNSAAAESSKKAETKATEVPER